MASKSRPARFEEHLGLLFDQLNEARAALEESMTLNLSVGARWNLGAAYQGLGAVAQAQGKHQQAVDMYRKGVDTFAELGGLFYVGKGLAQLGDSLLALDDEAEMDRLFNSSRNRVRPTSRGRENPPCHR